MARKGQERSLTLFNWGAKPLPPRPPAMLHQGHDSVHFTPPSRHEEVETRSSRFREQLISKVQGKGTATGGPSQVILGILGGQ